MIRRTYPKRRRLLYTVLSLIILLPVASAAFAQVLPGSGIRVQPVDQGIIEEDFQLEIVISGLKRLGYQVKPSISLTQEVGTPHLMVAQGDADFFAVHWDPLHNHFFEKVGGQESVYRFGALVKGCMQGYLIDKKTADKYDIRSIDRLKDPDIAALFDTNGDAKADLAGCHEGWGCFQVIEHHLDAYQLRDSINHHQRNYFQMIDDTIHRYRSGQSIFYYTWTPLWVSGVLVPGKDVEWLSVPFSALPEGRENTDTTLADGRNLGFGINTIRILANKQFSDANPAARRLFELITIPLNDISAQNLRIRNGERRPRDIRRHAQEWIEANKTRFDGWISEALKAGR
jgi:glycine betaine/proline transport system substrate-binding protein